MKLGGHPGMVYRPGRLARAVLTAVAVVQIGLIVIVGHDWLWAIGATRLLMRYAAAAFLTLILNGYLLIVAAAVPGAVILGGLIGWLERQRTRRPGAWLRGKQARWLLLCISVVMGSVLAEAAAAGWLAWIHRMPALPGRFVKPETQGDEIRIALIGGSSALGVPYEGWLSLGEIIRRELERAIPSPGSRSRCWPKREPHWRPCIRSSPA